MGESIVGAKSYAFAIRIVRLNRQLVRRKIEFVLSRQILRAGTSIGANVEEALGGQSKRDFLAKISIAYKEAREASYWLELLKDVDYISRGEFESLNSDLEELSRLLARIQLTTKKNLNKAGTIGR